MRFRMGRATENWRRMSASPRTRMMRQDGPQRLLLQGQGDLDHFQRLSTSASADERAWRALRLQASRPGSPPQMLRHSHSYGASTSLNNDTWGTPSQDYRRWHPSERRLEKYRHHSEHAIRREQLLHQSSSASFPLRLQSGFDVDVAAVSSFPSWPQMPRSAPISPAIDNSPTYHGPSVAFGASKQGRASPSHQNSGVDSRPRSSFSPEAVVAQYESRLEERETHQQGSSSSFPTTPNDSRSEPQEESRVLHDVLHGQTDIRASALEGREGEMHRHSASQSPQLQRMEEEKTRVSSTSPTDEQVHDHFVSAHSSLGSIAALETGAFDTALSKGAHTEGKPITAAIHAGSSSPLSSQESSTAPTLNLMRKWWREDEAMALRSQTYASQVSDVDLRGLADGVRTHGEHADPSQDYAGNEARGGNGPVDADYAYKGRIREFISSLPKGPPTLPDRISSRVDSTRMDAPSTVKPPTASLPTLQASGLVAAAGPAPDDSSHEEHIEQIARGNSLLESRFDAIDLPETPLKRQQFQEDEQHQKSVQSRYSAFIGSEEDYRSGSSISPSTGSELTRAGSRAGIGLGIDLRSFDGSAEDFSHFFFFDGRKPRPREDGIGPSIYHAHGVSPTFRAPFSLSSPPKKSRARPSTSSTTNNSIPPSKVQGAGINGIAVPALGEAGPSNWQETARQQRASKGRRTDAEYVDASIDTIQKRSSSRMSSNEGELVAGPDKARRVSRLSSEEGPSADYTATKEQRASLAMESGEREASHEKSMQTQAAARAGRAETTAPIEEEQGSVSEVEAFAFNPGATAIPTAKIECVKQTTVPAIDIRQVAVAIQLDPPFLISQHSKREESRSAQGEDSGRSGRSLVKAQRPNLVKRKAVALAAFMLQVVIVALFFTFEAPFLWYALSPAAAVVPIYLFAGTLASFLLAMIRDAGSIPSIPLVNPHEKQQNGRTSHRDPVTWSVTATYLPPDLQMLDDDSPRKKLALARLRQHVLQTTDRIRSPEPGFHDHPKTREEAATHELQSGKSGPSEMLANPNAARALPTNDALGRRAWAIYQQDAINSDDKQPRSTSKGKDIFLAPLGSGVKKWRRWRRKTVLGGLFRPTKDLEGQPVPRITEINGATLLCRQCNECGIYPPPRAFHCDICQHCTRHSYGHFRWIANDVGAGNLAQFLGFLVFAILSLSYISVFAALHLNYLAKLPLSASADSLPGVDLVPDLQGSGVGSFRQALRAAPFAAILFLVAMLALPFIANCLVHCLLAARKGQTVVQKVSVKRQHSRYIPIS